MKCWRIWGVTFLFRRILEESYGSVIKTRVALVSTAVRARAILVFGIIRLSVPERLAKDLLGLSIDYHVLSRRGRILGLTTYGDVGVPIYDNPEHPDYCFIDRKTVLIDKSLVEETANKGRYHFTLAHEICRQIFRMLFPKEYAPDGIHPRVHYCSWPPSLENRWEEWRTNRLASAVLMPADMVQINMLAFGLGDKLRLLNRIFAPQEYEQFSTMADYMGVSKKALSVRLKQLGLLELDYLDSPHEFLSVYPDEGEMKSDAESEYPRS